MLAPSAPVLPLTATDEDIRALAVRWTELLANGRFDDALRLFPVDQPQQPWTGTSLADWLSNYGYDKPTKSGKKYAVTSLVGLPGASEVIKAKIQVDRHNLYGLDPNRYLGVVHHDAVPLNGKLSDLTAIFNILRVGPDNFTLEFVSVHVQ